MKYVYIVFVKFDEQDKDNIEGVFAIKEKARQHSNKLKDLYDCESWVAEEEVE